MTSKTHVPLHFDSLTILQLQNIEARAIATNNNTVRFCALKAAKGAPEAQKQIMTFLKENPDWLR